MRLCRGCIMAFPPLLLQAPYGLAAPILRCAVSFGLLRRQQLLWLQFTLKQGPSTLPMPSIVCHVLKNHGNTAWTYMCAVGILAKAGVLRRVATCFRATPPTLCKCDHILPFLSCLNIVCCERQHIASG